MPRPCAIITSPTGAARAATGSPATFRTRRAAASMCASRGPTTVPAPPANGPTPPPASTAISSIDRSQSWFSHPRRCNDRGAPLPRFAATGSRCRPFAASAARIAGRCLPAVSQRTARPGDNRRSLSAGPWHHRTTRLARLALPPVRLLSAHGLRHARILASPARRSHPPRRNDHRHPAHLARSPALDESASRRSSPGAWGVLGNGVRLGTATDVLAAGEGLETMLALKSVLPALPMIAGLSANHLAALEWPPTLRRLYVARDND